MKQPSGEVELPTNVAMKQLPTLFDYSYPRLTDNRLINRNTPLGDEGNLYLPGVRLLCSLICEEKRAILSYAGGQCTDNSDTRGAERINFYLHLLGLTARCAGEPNGNINDAILWLVYQISFEADFAGSEATQLRNSVKRSKLQAMWVKFFSDGRTDSEKYLYVANTVVELAEMACMLRDDARFLKFRELSADGSNPKNPHISILESAKKMRNFMIECCDFLSNSRQQLKSADLMARYQNCLSGW